MRQRSEGFNVCLMFSLEKKVNLLVISNDITACFTLINTDVQISSTTFCFGMIPLNAIQVNCSVFLIPKIRITKLKPKWHMFDEMYNFHSAFLLSNPFNISEIFFTMAALKCLIFLSFFMLFIFSFHWTDCFSHW